MGVLKGVQRLLRAHEYEPILFSSAEAFKNHTDFETAACVILDINLNDGSGIELRQGLKVAGISVPVIYMTGNEDPAVRTAVLDSGCIAASCGTTSISKSSMRNRHGRQGCELSAPEHGGSRAVIVAIAPCKEGQYFGRFVCASVSPVPLGSMSRWCVALKTKSLALNRETGRRCSGSALVA